MSAGLAFPAQALRRGVCAARVQFVLTRSIGCEQDADITSAARANWREPTLDTMLEYLLSQSTQQDEAVVGRSAVSSGREPSAVVATSSEVKSSGKGEGQEEGGEKPEDVAEAVAGSSPLQAVQTPHTLQVGNIDRAVTHEDLREAVCSYSGCACVSIKFVKSSRALVTLDSGANEQAAISALDGKCIGKSLKPLSVRLARTKRTAREAAAHAMQGQPVEGNDETVATRLESSEGGRASDGATAPGHAPLEVANLQADVEAERNGRVCGVRGMAPGTDSQRVEPAWHALDSLQAFESPILTAPSDCDVNSISAQDAAAAAGATPARTCLLTSTSDDDTNSLADRYNRMLLGKALLAFEGYAQAENIQRWSGALNSPKTATIFEKWKKLPVSGSVHGVIGQGIKKQQVKPGPASEDRSWPAAPLADADSVFTSQAAGPTDGPGAHPLHPAYAPTMDLHPADHLEPGTGLTHQQMMAKGATHSALPGHANAFGACGWNGQQVVATPSWMQPYADTAGDILHQQSIHTMAPASMQPTSLNHHHHQPYWHNPFYSMAAHQQPSTGDDTSLFLCSAPDSRHDITRG